MINKLRLSDPAGGEMIESLKRAISSLDAWVMSSNWRGYDPYDVKGTTLYLGIAKGNSLPKKAMRRLLLELTNRWPLAVRHVLGVPRTVNAKAMGLFAAAYARLFSVTGDKEFFKKAVECADWLLQHPAGGYPGLSWGYPFDWRSVIFIPKGTPSGVVTGVAGEGFWLLYEITKDERFLDACSQICEFFLEGLNRTYESSDALCFSYTPLDDYRVHNANLFVAEFLCKTGREKGNEQWQEIAVRCGNFAAQDQNSDGSICYWAKSQQASHSGGECRIDHYHTGFEIRKLYGLWKATEKDEFRRSYLSYLEFYKRNFVGVDGLPKMTPSTDYPVNIHSCAEAILLTATLARDHPELKNLAQTFFHWTRDNMEVRPGEYLYLINKTRMGLSRVDIPFIRWNQAWMFRALTELLVALSWKC